jgi:hypothetical protein
MASILAEQRSVRKGITDEERETSDISTVSDQQTTLLESPLWVVELPSLNRRVIFEVEGSLPAWFTNTVQALDQLGSLQDNWDSYGAPRISSTSILAALELLASVMGEKTPTPAVVPTNRGHVLLEWHTHGVDLEVEAVSSQYVHVMFEDVGNAIEWERDLGSDLTPLVECLQRLSQTD